MQIAIFGGTFDPPHRGHQEIAEEMIRQKIVDQVWFMPVGNHPFARNTSSEKDRLAMLRAVEADRKLHNSAWLNGQIRIEEYELGQAETSYSLKTLEALSHKFPEHTFSWLIGSDNLASFAKWHNYAELLDKFTVYVYPREGSLPQTPERPLLPGMIFLEKLPVVTVSSTEIRRRVLNKENISRDVSPGVLAYIQRAKLYQDV